MRVCPKCGSSKTTTERRPDGYSWCNDCDYRWKTGQGDLPTADVAGPMKTINKPPRRILQLTEGYTSAEYTALMLAVCDDGSMWEFVYPPGLPPYAGTWRRFPDIPQE